MAETAVDQRPAAGERILTHRAAGHVHRTGVTSVASVGGHPLHPMMIPFPVAFLTATLASDLAARRTRNPFWCRASRWLLRAGLASGAAAAALGAVDYLALERVRRNGAGNFHAAGNALALGLAYANLRARRGLIDDVPPRGLALSAATAALLAATAWAGGELVYRHRVAVVETEDAGE